MFKVFNNIKDISYIEFGLDTTVYIQNLTALIITKSSGKKPKVTLTIFKRALDTPKRIELMNKYLVTLGMLVQKLDTKELIIGDIDSGHVIKLVDSIHEFEVYLR